MTYDAAVLGGGPAGCRFAETASASGMSVLLFEKKALGGTTAEEGCSLWPPLLRELDLFLRARSRGLAPQGTQFPLGASVNRALLDIEMHSSSLAETLAQRGVTVVPYGGALTGRRGRFFRISAGGEEFEAKRVVLATGSMTAYPDFSNVDELRQSGFIQNPYSLIRQKSPPPSLCVVGSGFKALQMAAFYAVLGSHVTVLEKKRSIAPGFDSDLADWMVKYLKSLGVEFVTGAKITALTDNRVLCTLPSGKRAFQASNAVFGEIRWPLIRAIGLDAIGVLTNFGEIVSDLTLRTSVPDVYAAGDASGRGSTAADAALHAETILAAMCGKRPPMLIRPPVTANIGGGAASVGESSRSAIKLGRKIAQTKITIPPAYSQDSEQSGLIKLIADRHTGQLLGAHMLGADVIPVCQELALCIDAGMTPESAARHMSDKGGITYFVREALARLGRLLN